MTTPKEKITVVHHSADFDGLFCREIARKFMPDAELIGWDFKDKPLAVPEGKIYILDLPVDRVFGYNFALPGIKEALPVIDFSKIIWIDHHKSSIESHPTDIPGYRIDGVAACRLAWQFFSTEQRVRNEPLQSSDDIVVGFMPEKQAFIDRTVSEPLAVRLAGEYDIWDKRDPNAELFQHGLRSRELTEKWWGMLLEPGREVPGASTFSEQAVAELLEAGKVLQYARAQEYADVITQQGFDIEFEGLKFLACNSHELDIRSHLFAAGIQPHHDALLGFTYNGKSKDWRVSMYHAPGKEQHDLSVIAKKHGGGGHRGACGFRMEKLPFLP